MLDRNEENLENWLFEQEMTQSEIQWLREQVISLKKLLEVELKRKQELEQELHYTNQELVKMAKELCQLDKYKQLTFEQACELAKTLVDEYSVGKALTKLLSAIYGKTVLPEELPSIQKLVSSRHLSSQRERYNLSSEKYAKLRAQFIELGS